MKARLGIICTLLVVFGAASPSLAQPAGTAHSLLEANYQAGLGHWTEAVDLYRKILETAGDDLMPAPAPLTPLAQLAGSTVFTIAWQSPRSLPARWIVHEQISHWPPAALKLYRDRLDAVAANRFDEVRDRADSGPLEQIVADWFNSWPAEDAILLLAQRSFERADFDAAERYWMLLLPGPSDRLRYPDPRTPAATLRARLILVRLFRGETQQARLEIVRYRADYPDAAGLLAGQDGKFADTLEGLLKVPRSVLLPAPTGDGMAWTTFGGQPSRNSLITGTMPTYWPGPPTWRAELPSGGKFRAEDRPPAIDQPGSLALHPVIAQGRAFVADSMRVYSFDLSTGTSAIVFDLRRSLPIPGIDARLPMRGEQRCTLSFANSFLYVRLGAQQLRPSPPRPEGPDTINESASAIVCLGPISAKKIEPIPHAWTLRPARADADATAIFEGTPLVHGGRLFSVLWRQAGGALARSIVCYRLGTDEVPELLWQREVDKSGLNAVGDVRARHDLLTLAGPNLIFCTNAGSVTAVNAISGKPAWEYRYTVSERRPPPIGRDLCPGLFDGRHLFAAPADSDRLFCLDAMTGQMLWEREGVDVVHLLGVVRGRLIATFAGSLKGMRGIQVDTGSESRPDGWIQHDGDGASTFGRGLATPDLIYWPTKQGMQFLRPDDGTPARQPAPGLFGNLAYADGCFVVVNATEILGYVSDGRQPSERPPFIERSPASKLLIWDWATPDRTWSSDRERRR